VNGVQNRGVPPLYLPLGVLLIGVFVFMIFVFNGSFMEYYPHKLLENCPHLPISSSDKSNDVIAKFDLENIQIDRVLEWYGGRGFTTDAFGSEAYGFGPHGVSFDIFATNGARTLVVKQWKDM
jgi:hypothetical protein